MTEKKKPSVFISYSHKDEIWKDHLQRHLEVLENVGKINIWEDRKIDHGGKWFNEINDAMRNAAVAVCLISSDLKAIHGHHISNSTKIPDLNIPVEKGRHPRRIIAAFEERFNNNSEHELLQILGLFDRPAPIETINKVKEAPAIPKLTGQLQTLDEVAFIKVCTNLRNLKLIAETSKHNPDGLDCHPLVREHFSEMLKSNKPKAWKEAHNRLYEYYRDLPKEYPDTLEEMEPLFIAIAHGCMADKHSEVLIGVYWNRISRKNEFYSTDKLGAYGTDLAVLSNFFEIPWSKSAEGLSFYPKFAVSWAGFRLRALGQLREAVEPMKTALEALIKQKDFKNMSIEGGNLSELFLTLGNVQKSIDYGLQSVEFADKSRDDSQKTINWAICANALLQSGDIFGAENLFQQAENIQKIIESEAPYLYSVQGFWFCDLLLSQGKYAEVHKRTINTIEIATRNNWLNDIALDSISKGCAYLMQTIEEKSNNFTEATNLLPKAVNGLQQAGTIYNFPLGLLSRAALFREKKEFTQAWIDLEETFEIAEQGEMKLHLTDYHLEACRLSIAEKELDKAQEHLKEAETLIKETGYGRRKKDVDELEAVLIG